MPIHLVLSGTLTLKWGRQLFAVAPPMAQHWAMHPSLCQGGGGFGDLLAVASPLPQRCMSQAHNASPAQAHLCKKYAIGVEEVERQWADRVLDCLNNMGDEQRVVQ